MKKIINLKIRYLFYLLMIFALLFIICEHFFNKLAEFLVVVGFSLFFYIFLPLFIIQIIYKILKKESIVSLELEKELKYISKILGFTLIIFILVIMLNFNYFFSFNHGIGSTINNNDFRIIIPGLFVFNLISYILFKITLLFVKLFKS